MNNHAIVIFYVGKKPSTEVIEIIANAMVNRGVTVPELLEIKHFDSNGVAKAILEKGLKPIIPESGEKDPLEQACILIAERFKESLPKSGDGGTEFMLTFHDTLSSAMRRAIHYGQDTSDEDKALINASELITSNLENIPNAMIARTGVRKFALRIVAAIYKKLSENVLA